MANNIQLGIIGFGGMAHWHYNNIARAGCVTVRAVHDINEAALADAREKGLIAYENREDLLKNEEIDCILIATPNDFHCPYAVEAMRFGKHVLSEKPVSLSSAELQEMIDASKQYHKIFTVHQNRRWDKDYQIIKSIVQGGEIGHPYSIQSRVMGSRGIPGDWRAEKKHGGGMVLDWGVHLIDQALDMMAGQKVTDVYVRMQHVKYSEVDDGFQVFLTFESGTVYLIEVVTATYINLPRWHVSGTQGTVLIDDWDCTGKIVTVQSGRENEDATPIQAGAGLTKTMAPRGEESIIEKALPEVSGDWAEFYQNLAACIKGTGELVIKPSQVMRCMKVMEAIFESEEKNQAIHTQI